MEGSKLIQDGENSSDEFIPLEVGELA